MKIGLWKCDYCQKEFRSGGGSEVELHVNNSRDPVDGHNQREYKRADLCGGCQGLLLKDLIEALPVEQRAKLAREWGAK
ncbi:MAG: hypothetical protein IT168_33350 [Bryobacterales bacterium]|nr:hypothetical protein [Bryobacterales bacterium]